MQIKMMGCGSNEWNTVGGRWRGRRRKGGGSRESMGTYTSKLETGEGDNQKTKTEQSRHKITSLQPDTKLWKMNKFIYDRLHPEWEMTPIELEFLAALSSSRSLVVGPLVRDVCEKVTLRVSKGNYNKPASLTTRQ